jgi:hypothetical protein
MRRAFRWVNFGSPRIAYGGYQTGLAFYKAVSRASARRRARPSSAIG